MSLPTEHHPLPRANTVQQTSQVATSNQTVSKVLGGRSYSWMSDAQPTTNLVRPSVVRKRKAPTDDSGTDGNAPHRRVSFPPSLAPDTANTSDVLSGNQPVLPSPALTDEPSPATICTQTNSPNNGGSGLAAAPPPQHFVIPDRGPERDTPLNTTVLQMSSAPEPQRTSDARVQNRRDAQIRERAMALAAGLTAPSSSSSAGGATPPTQVNYGAYAPAQDARSSSSQNTQRQRQSARADRNHRLEVVNARLAKCRVERTLNESDAGRYRVLREACENKDLYYVALHQTLCRWSLDKHAIHSSLGRFARPEDVDNGLVIVESFLKPNGSLSFSQLQWFSDFPDSTLEITRLPKPLADWVGLLLRSLCRNWSSLIETVATRRYPLLVSEMNRVLACNSPTLQQVLFTMSYRYLRVQDTNWGTVLNDAFSREQQNEVAIAMNNAPPDDITRIRSDFANYYKDVVARSHTPYQLNMNSTSPIMQQYISAIQQNSRHLQGHPRVPTSHAGSPAPAAAPFAVQPQPQPQPPVQATAGPVATSPTTMGSHLPHGNMSGQNVNHQMQSPVVPHLPMPRNHPPQTQADIGQSVPQLPILRSHAFSPGLQARQQPSPVNTLTRVPGPNPPVQGLQFPPHLQHLSDASVRSPTLPGAGPGAPVEHESLQRAPSNNLPQSLPPLHSPFVTGIQPGAQPQAPPGYPPQLPSQQRAHRTNMSGQNPPPVNSRTCPGLETEVTEISVHQYPISPYGRHSLQVGLHLVGVRSPKRVPAEPMVTRFYQYIQDTVVPPHLLIPQNDVHHFDFDVPAAHVDNLTKIQDSIGLPTCSYRDGSCRYRLRICMKPNRETEVRLSDWVVSPSCWPRHVFITFNHQPMLLSRKQQFQKDLPLELTDKIREGSNRVSISFPATPDNMKRQQSCFVAIELVQTSSYSTLKKYITSSRNIAIDAMKKKIQQRLRPLDSDEVMITNDGLKVSITDPFSSRLFHVPVRGLTCRHLECFDLENWLQTRSRKPTQRENTLVDEESEPSLVDDWKCPICGGDARPTNIGIDQYLVQVRKELLARGQESVKAITIMADATWSPIEEPDESEETTPAPHTPHNLKSDIGRTNGAPIVIEID